MKSNHTRESLYFQLIKHCTFHEKTTNKYELYFVILSHLLPLNFNYNSLVQFIQLIS